MANLGQMNRRAFLRGAGTLLALPLFLLNVTVEGLERYAELIRKLGIRK